MNWRMTAIVLAAFASLQASVPRAQADELLVGVAGPMTGKLAEYGEQLRRGAELAVRDVNAAGGVLGQKVVLEIADDACKPPQALEVADRLIGQGAVLVVGHFCSGSSIPAAGAYGRKRLLQITPASSNPVLTDEAAALGIRTVMRTCGRDDREGALAGTWLAKRYAGKRIAILHDGSGYGQLLADRTRESLRGHGVQESLNERFTADSGDFSALISKMKNAGIDAIYVGAYTRDVAQIIRQARQQGLGAALVSGDALDTPKFWSMSGAAGEGVVFTRAVSAIDLASAGKVVARLRADKHEPGIYTLSTYAAIQAWAAAANLAGSTDGETVAQALRRNGASTIIGDLQWDAKGDLVDPGFAMFMWSGGRMVPADANP